MSISLQMMEEKFEFHFILSHNFLRHTPNCSSLEELYQNIKTCSVFAALHTFGDKPHFDHIHLVHDEKIASKSQKIQNLTNKLRRKIGKINEQSFREQLKLSNCVIAPAQRRQTAQTIINNGTINNAHCLSLTKSTAFSSLIRNLPSTSDLVGNEDTIPSCLSFFSQENLAKCGIEVPRNDEYQMMMETDNSNESCNASKFREGDAKDNDEDEEDDDEDEDEEEGDDWEDEEEEEDERYKMKKNLSKKDKWQILQTEINKTDALTLKEFYLRCNPRRFPYFFCRIGESWRKYVSEIQFAHRYANLHKVRNIES